MVFRRTLDDGTGFSRVLLVTWNTFRTPETSIRAIVALHQSHKKALSLAKDLLGSSKGPMRETLATLEDP